MIKTSRSRFRIFAGFGLMLCILILFAAFTIQYLYQLQPCLLCLLERYIIFVITVLFLLSFIHNPIYVGRYIYFSCLVVFCLLGIILSGRHIWLQHLPLDQMPSCSAGLEQMLQYQPILQVFKTILTTVGECGKIDFRLFGLSLAGYSFIAFIIILLYSLFYCPLNKQRRT